MYLAKRKKYRSKPDSANKCLPAVLRRVQHLNQMAAQAPPAEGGDGLPDLLQRGQKVADQHDLGMAGQGLSQKEVASRLALHPFVVHNTMRLASSVSGEEAVKMHKKLFQIELLVKTGRMDPSLSLDFFFAEL